MPEGRLWSLTQNVLLGSSLAPGHVDQNQRRQPRRDCRPSDRLGAELWPSRSAGLRYPRRVGLLQKFVTDECTVLPEAVGQRALALRNRRTAPYNAGNEKTQNIGRNRSLQWCSTHLRRPQQSSLKSASAEPRVLFRYSLLLEIASNPLPYRRISSRAPFSLVEEQRSMSNGSVVRFQLKEN
jgi:hypothetical protein